MYIIEIEFEICIMEKLIIIVFVIVICVFIGL